MSATDLERSGPTSRIYFSQRLRLHYVDWGNPEAPPLLLLGDVEEELEHDRAAAREMALERADALEALFPDVIADK